MLQHRNKPQFAEAEPIEFEEIKTRGGVVPMVPCTYSKPTAIEKIKNKIPPVNPQAAKIVLSELVIIAIRLVYWSLIFVLGFIISVGEFLVGLIRKEPAQHMDTPQAQTGVSVSVRVEVK